jgi:hypothetical protein
VGDEVRVTEDGGRVVETGPEEDDDGMEDDVGDVVVTTASKADAAENKNSQTSISQDMFKSNVYNPTYKEWQRWQPRGVDSY